MHDNHSTDEWTEYHIKSHLPCDLYIVLRDYIKTNLQNAPALKNIIWEQKAGVVYDLSKLNPFNTFNLLK